MDLGVFSIGLTVKDIAASRNVYEKFGFRVFAGESTTGPAGLIAVDPDGNPILLDQHV